MIKKLFAKIALLALLVPFSACVYEMQSSNFIRLTLSQHDKWNFEMVASGFAGFELWVYVYGQEYQEEVIPILQMLAWLDIGFVGLETITDWSGDISISRQYTEESIVWYFDYDGIFAQVSFPLHTSQAESTLASTYTFSHDIMPIYEDIPITLLTRHTDDFTYKFKLIMTN